MPSTAASNWHCSTPITTSTAFAHPHLRPATAKPARCRCCVRASGHPVDEAARVLAPVIRPHPAPFGPGSRSRCELATAITARPRSWTCWRIRATGYILGLPGNARLSEIGQPWCEDAALRRVQSGKRQGAPPSRPATRPKAGHASARSLPASRPTARGTDVRFGVD